MTHCYTIHSNIDWMHFDHPAMVKILEGTNWTVEFEDGTTKELGPKSNFGVSKGHKFRFIAGDDDLCYNVTEFERYGEWNN